MSHCHTRLSSSLSLYKHTRDRNLKLQCWNANKFTKASYDPLFSQIANATNDVNGSFSTNSEQHFNTGYKLNKTFETSLQNDTNTVLCSDFCEPLQIIVYISQSRSKFWSDSAMVTICCLLFRHKNIFPRFPRFIIHCLMFYFNHPPWTSDTMSYSRLMAKIYNSCYH